MKYPRPFNRPITARKFKRRVVSRIFLDPDREFVGEITGQDEQGKIVVARDLSGEEVKRLKKLLKEIKKNRGAFSMFKVAVLLILVGGVLLFNVLFRDKLVERYTERGLEALFRAQADISGVDFRPLRGELGFSSLTIADESRPMFNLLESGAGRASIDTWQLVTRSVLIEELSLQDVVFGGEREKSGALVDSGAGEGSGGEAAADGADGSAGGFAMPDLSVPDTLDAEAFLQQNLDLLSLPKEVEAMRGLAESYTDKWQGEFETLRGNVGAASSQIETFAQTDFRSIRSVEELQGLYEEARSIEASVGDVADRVEVAYSDAAREAEEIAARARALPGLIQSDYDTLLSQIPDIRGEGAGIVVGIVQPYLQEALGVWYDRAMRGYELFGRLSAMRDSPEKTPRDMRQGEDIVFSTTQYPKFWMKRAFLSSADLTLDLREATSDQELTGKPTTLKLDYTAQSLVLDARYDENADVGGRLSIEASATERPIALSRGLEVLDLDRIAGDATIRTTLNQNAGGGFSGDLTFLGTAMIAEGDVGEFSIGGLVADVLNSASQVDGEFGYAIDSGGAFSFTSGKTNVDDAISEVAQERIAAAVEEFKAQLYDELVAYLDPQVELLNGYMGDVLGVQTSTEEILSLAQDREAAAAELESMAQGALSDVRGQIEAEAQAVIDAAQAEAEEAARAAREQAEAEAAAIQAEAERRATEAQAAAEREAESRVRDAASNAGSRFSF